MSSGPASTPPGAPTSRDIRTSRGPRAAVDPTRPAAFFCEPEASPRGVVEQVATLFLVNRECPFTCAFCDLWKQTTETPVSAGQILGQIDLALAALPAARHIKLYNAGNFFDPQAIPPEAWPGIADRVCGYETVIVENHPRLLGEGCLRFRDLLRDAWARGPVVQHNPTSLWQHDLAGGPPNPRLEAGATIPRESSETTTTSARLVGDPAPDWPTSPPVLEVAMGLETVHPAVWPRLNKQMTPEEFRRAVGWLRLQGIEARAFVLLQPPYLPRGDDAVAWALKGVEFAFDAGVRVVAVIPTRGGNGWLEGLAACGEFTPPTLAQLGQVLRGGLKLGRGRVFVDLWDAGRLEPGGVDPEAELALLRDLNLTQGR